MEKYLLIGAAAFFAVMSLVALVLYKADKVKAEKGKWRTKEATLLGFGFFGGAVGALAGMKLFRHKTKHWYFWVVNWAGLVWQLALLGFLAFKLIQAR
jgi:uncharacterized membrane protein YsdA (DUF1294 family)